MVNLNFLLSICSGLLDEPSNRYREGGCNPDMAVITTHEGISIPFDEDQNLFSLRVVDASLPSSNISLMRS